MSLGFLTESALVPSKAKSIKVDSNSLVDLQAVIYKKEQEQRRKGTDEASHATTLRGKRGARAAASKSSSKSAVKSNRGIEKRKQKDDEDELLGEDERAKKKRSRQILIEKAKLYDDLAAGRKVLAQPLSTMDNDPSAPLVNFAEKISRHVTGEASSFHKDHEFIDESSTRPVPVSTPLTIETQDKFGRTVSTPFVAGKADPTEPSPSLQSSSYVVSQWERTLKQQEKGFLHQVHEEAKLAKLTMADKTQRKQARLAKLQLALRAPPTPAAPEGQRPPIHDATSYDAVVSSQAERDAAAFLSTLL